MTAKEEGLWDPIGHRREEIRHMHARVELYRATHQVGKTSEDFDHSPECASSWCRWVVVDSVRFAARQAPRSCPGRAARQARRPAALPALGSIEQPSPVEERRAEMSSSQKDRIAQNREQAVQRKLQKQRGRKVQLPELPDEDEDPFGLGASFDD
jgi:hypothetical protein